MTEKKSFSELPLATRIATIVVCIPFGALLLAVIAIGAGFLWKAVLWAWN